MLYYIYDGQIAGYCGDAELEPPQGFTIAEGPDGGIPDLFFNGAKVEARPPSPDPSAYWQDRGWVIPDMPQPPAPVVDPVEEGAILLEAVAAVEDPLVRGLLTLIYSEIRGDRARYLETFETLKNALSERQ